jgi:competence ComEA-like helix-hairpin-helix protein
MSSSQFLKDYFTFTRKERIGLLTLLTVIIGIWIFPKLATHGRSEKIITDTSWIIASRQLSHQENSRTDLRSDDDVSSSGLEYDKPVGNTNTFKKELFYFDPNSLSFEGWKKLGLRDKTITTIQKYLSKGGHFDNSEDLRKIYGIHTDEYERLKPFVKIERINKNVIASDFKNESAKKEVENKNLKYHVVDINLGDTLAFIALPGIGSKLAARIISFREKLGGFYSIEQVAETYGLADSTFQKIKIYLSLDNNSVRKININTASKDEMKSHPYIRWNLANAIVEYRNQHGSFSSLEELKKISLITDPVFDKMKFYLTF